MLSPEFVLFLFNTFPYEEDKKLEIMMLNWCWGVIWWWDDPPLYWHIYLDLSFPASTWLQWGLEEPWGRFLSLNPYSVVKCRPPSAALLLLLLLVLLLHLCTCWTNFCFPAAAEMKSSSCFCFLHLLLTKKLPCCRSTEEEEAREQEVWEAIQVFPPYNSILFVLVLI